MKIFIVDGDHLSKFTLPAKIEETYILSYRPYGRKEENMLTFESQDNKWILKSNGSCDLVRNNEVLPACFLEEYNHYNIKLSGYDKVLTMYVAPTVNEQTFKIDFKNLEEIKVGKAASCNIQYNEQIVPDLTFSIKLIENVWYICNVGDNLPVFLNGKRIKQAKISVGDIVFFHGLKIIWMKSFLEVNNPRGLINANSVSPYEQLNLLDNTQYDKSLIDDADISLYKESDYFFHIPRMKEELENVEITIDSPPPSEVKEDLPFLLTMGSSLTMAASSFMMIYNVGYSLYTGSRSVYALIPQMVMCIAMLIGSLIIPRIANAYQNKKRKQREQLRQIKYSEYLLEKETKISAIIKQQEQIEKDHSFSTKDCLSIINPKNRSFWCREISDDDFLNVRLGLGNVPAKIKIQAPIETFSLDSDHLFKQAASIADKHKLLKDVPVNVSLTDKNITALIFDCPYKDDYIDSLMTQIVTLHSAEDLKIVIFTNAEKSSRWQYTKFLPHCWSETKEKRFFVTNEEELRDVSDFLMDELKKRRVGKPQKVEEGEEKKSATEKKFLYRDHSPYYLIINDDFQFARQSSIITELLDAEFNYGFSLLVIEDSMKNLPTKCKAFIDFGAKDGAILQKNISSELQVKFVNEYEQNLDMMDIAYKLANVPIMDKDSAKVLPTSLNFLDMYGVSKVEQLNILNRWQVNNPVNGLSAPIGVHTNGDIFKLNLHEKFHGPHGLVAGSTGSGKSEFIITYILSMAINYHPYEVQFVLIDYKGGGLAGAFENKETGVHIPHLVGTITNLDTSEMNRTLVSIESEMKRRQKKFNEVRDSLGEGTIDIYKYQKLYRDGVVKEPMAHLFIISDEFAELKAQQPEFMTQLVSTARIGRSLGVHLILATQKPSGVVNDQIWSNSKFKICLKVQDRSDSMEMLKRPEAASIKETGRFYLQVGYDDLFEIGQSGWSGAKYVPSDRIIKKVDDSINFINNIGEITKSIKDELKVEEKIEDKGDQLTNIVKYIYDLGVKEEFYTSKLWLPSIPSEVFIKSLKEKYKYAPTPYLISPLIGEYDNPSAQQQGPVNLNLTTNGNTLIYGQVGSGKENLLTTLIWSLCTEHTPEEVSLYIMDFGSESLKMFNKFPHVGEVVTVDDIEKIEGTFEFMMHELERRKELFADYAGSYIDYCENSGEKLPLYVNIINNYEIFTENCPKLSEAVMSLYRDGFKYGIVYVISAIATNAIRNRMAQNFNNKICLQLPNDGDYRTLLNSPKGLMPAKIFGRGIVTLDDNAYEFQTAYFTERKQITNVVRMAGTKLQEIYPTVAKKVPFVPDVVYYRMIKDQIDMLTNVPIGYSLDTKEVFKYDFQETPFNMVITEAMTDDRMSFVYSLMRSFSSIYNVQVKVIDLVHAYEKAINNIICYNDNFDNAIITMNNDVVQGKDKPGSLVYFILGAGVMQSKLSATGKEVMNRLFTAISSYKNAHFILVDTYSSFKNLQVETWYQTGINHNNGIWLGGNVGGQMAINATAITMEDRKVDFPCLAFSVHSGKHTIIKHVVENVEESHE